MDESFLDVLVMCVCVRAKEIEKQGTQLETIEKFTLV